MVLINNLDVLSKLRSYYPRNRMPLLCGVYRSFGRRIISENNEYEKGIRSEVYDINTGGGSENYLTCIALSEDGIVAFGSGNKEGSLYFVKDRSAIKDIESGVRFKPLHKEMLASPIHSLDWTGNKLLVGLNNGTTNLYNVKFDQDVLEEFTLLGQYINSPAEIQMHAPFYISNTHVKSAVFSSINNLSADSTFLSTTQNQISVWDQSNTSKPLYKIQSSSSPLQCASWSPNEPQSMIVFGGYDRKLSIVDTRVEKHQNVVWSVDNAHDRPVTDAKFNTFIPYWLASAGEDSIVNIWDIRSSYHAPVAKVDGNIGIVTSISWSSIRPENLATTASDGTMRFWSLYPENFPLWDTISRTTNYDNQDTLPIVRGREHNNIWCTKQQNYANVESTSWTNIWEDDDDHAEPISTMLLVGSMGLGTWGRLETGFIYKGEEVIPPKGSAVAVKESKLRPSTYYSVLSGGQLVSHTIRFDTESNLRYRHRYDPKDKEKLAAEIEDDIYCRRITKAHKKLDELKAEIKNDDHEESYRKEAVEFLQDCLQLREPIKENQWNFDSIPDRSNNKSSRRLWNDDEVWEHAIATFKSDLNYWSYRIPPGYNTRFKFPLDFDEPLIAERLIQKERILTELPPLIPEPEMDYPGNLNNDLSDAQTDATVDDPDIGLFDNDVKIEDDQTIYENATDNFSENDSKHDTERKKSILTYTDKPVARRFDLMDDEEIAGSQPIKDRRNMSHVPTIVTTQKEDDSNANKLNLATPPYSAQGMQRHSNNTFQMTTLEDDLAQSPTSITSNQHIEPPVSTNPFEESKKEAGAVSTNPFETPYKEIQNAGTANPFESANLEPSITSQHELTTNPFETSEDDSKSVKSLNQLDDNGSRRQSWMSNRLGLSMTVQTDGRQQQDDANSAKSSKKRHKFNVFKKLSRNKSSSNISEEQQQKQEDRILQRQSSTRRNALHGPF